MENKDVGSFYVAIFGTVAKTRMHEDAGIEKARKGGKSPRFAGFMRNRGGTDSREKERLKPQFINDSRNRKPPCKPIAEARGDGKWRTTTEA